MILIHLGVSFSNVIFLFSSSTSSQDVWLLILSYITIFRRTASLICRCWLMSPLTRTQSIKYRYILVTFSCHGRMIGFCILSSFYYEQHIFSNFLSCAWSKGINVNMSGRFISHFSQKFEVAPHVKSSVWCNKYLHRKLG